MPLNNFNIIKEMEIDLLHSQFQDAVKNGNVDDILKYGELYYRTLNGGEMTKEDKEQLQNDILLSAVTRKKDE